MDNMDAAWLFLKDYPTYIPGVEGGEGMNTPQWLPDMPEAEDRRWHDRFIDPGTKARMRAYKLQQAKFAQQMRDWYRDSRMSGPTDEPLFEAGPNQWGRSRDWFHSPGDKPRLVTADVDTDDPEYKRAKPYAAGEVLPRNILGEGGYLQALSNWLQGNRDTSKYGRERGMAALRDSPREFQVEPEEEKPEEEKPEEEKPEDELEPPGKDELEGLRTRRDPNTLEGATSPLADDWHKGFNKKGEHHPEDQSWGIYGDKLKLVHKKNFTVDPPESGRDNLHDFMDNKLLGGKDGPKAYYKVHMKDKLTKLFKENPKAGIKWLRAHPGWEEAIPDDFVWRDTGTAKEESENKGKDKGKDKDMAPVDKPPKPPPVEGGSKIIDDPEVGTSFDQLDPMDTAWAVLKLG